jgi:hypothetical protein
MEGCAHGVQQNLTSNHVNEMGSDAKPRQQRANSSASTLDVVAAATATATAAAARTWTHLHWCNFDGVAALDGLGTFIYANATTCCSSNDFVPKEAAQVKGWCHTPAHP